MTNEEITVIILTLKTAVLSTLFCIPISIFLGWVLARKNFVLKPLVEAMLSLPLVVPPVVTGYLLLLFLGRESIIGIFFYDYLGISLSFSFYSLVIASFFVSLPLAVRSIRAAFELVNPAYEKVALTLGIDPVSTFFKVTLPLCIPGILSGIVLAFARSLGEFGATITLAGNIHGKTQTIALMIYSKMQVPESGMQVTRLVVVSIILSLGTIILSEILSQRRAKTS